MKRTLLLVSKDEAMIETITAVNERYAFGYEIDVYVYTDAWEARVRQTDRVIVCLDFDEADAPEQARTLEEIKKRPMSMSYLIVKSSYENDAMRLYFKSGVFDCLTKPLAPDVFHRTLHEIKAQESSIQAGMQSQKQDRESIHSLKNSLAYDLIFGTIKNSKDIWDRSRWAGLSAVPSIALIVHIDDFFQLTRNKSKRWEQSIRSEVIGMIERFAYPDMQEVLPIVTAVDKVSVLLSVPLRNSKTEYKEVVTRYAKELKCYIKEGTGYTVTIGIGHYYEDARNLHVSYQEAWQAQTYKFFAGTDALLHIDDTEPFASEAALLPNDQIAALANKLAIGDFVGVKQTIEELWGVLFTQSNADPEVYKLQILELLTTLARAALNGGAKPKDIFSIHLRCARDLPNIENATYMKQWFKEAVEQFLESVLANHNEQMLKSVQKAMQYIDASYLSNITLEQVASHVHLSPNYFSYIFKKTTGSSFIEYITHLRIEKAKAMLMDLTYTVYHVASAVGYNDARYFSRVFKSIVGKTPSQYRNSMLVPDAHKKKPDAIGM
ncbi:AraC family transcriptional regulator [Aneurinibacillus sp. BA2021]|nr:AraC family transcriptional regulator [Aneurinibacillus sp. BA2021]